MTPPSLKLVAHQPWRRPLAIILTAVIATACLLVGYLLGENKIISGRVDEGSLSYALDKERTRAHALEAELIDAQLARDVHKNAADELRLEMQAMHRDSTQLGEELTFYKSLMAPGDVQEGLQIDELEITPSANGEFKFALLLTQVALRRSYIKGDVRVDVVGQIDDAQVVKSLTELGFEQAYPLKFRFRYFQDIVGTFALAPEFTPQKVLVTAKQNGKDEVQVSYPWLSSGLGKDDTDGA